MRAFFVSLVFGIVAFMLLFSGGMSVGAIPNTPTSQPTATPIPAYFNIISVDFSSCTNTGGSVSVMADAHTAGGAPVLLEWSGRVLVAGGVFSGSRTISMNGGVYNTVKWWADDAIYWQIKPKYKLEIEFRLYRYLDPSNKILLDRAWIFGTCGNTGTSSQIHNWPD